MSVINWMTWAITSETQLRVQAALNYIAAQIVNEPDTISGHSQRMVAAKKMLNGQVNIPDFVKLVAIDETIRGIIDNGEAPDDTSLLGAVERSLVVMSKAAI